MILVTGGTGFIGRHLIPQLAEMGSPVRILVRPSQESPVLPLGIPLEVAVSSLGDPRGLRASLVGVDTVYHLAGSEWQGVQGDLLITDIQGTQLLAEAAMDAGVKRFFFLSHLGAERASAYPVLKAKGIAEHHIRNSGLDYTILQPSWVYGEGDHFTTNLARLAASAFAGIPVPGHGESLLQPLWVNDLTACMVWALENESTRNQVYQLGGPEFLTLREVLGAVMAVIGLSRRVYPMRPTTIRLLTVFLEYLFPGLPVSVYWLDYLAVNRTCALDTIPRVFGIMPGRFRHHLSHLEGQRWGRESIMALIRRRRRGD